VWLELVRARDLTDVADRPGDAEGSGEEADGTGREHLTVGALVRFSTSTTEAKAWYFTTPLRAGHQLALLGEDRQPLSREGLAEVIGAASATRSTRTIGSGARAGEVIPVSTPTHVTGVLRHESGVLSTLVTSFDAVATTASKIEVHGDAGSLSVPDPNRFVGDVRLFALGDTEWRTLPVSAGYEKAARGYGVADMVWSARAAADEAVIAEPRASGELAYHVLEVMESMLASADSGRSVQVSSTVARPPAVPLTDR